MGIKEWRYSSLHLFPEAVWRGQAFFTVGVARGDDPNVRSLHSLNTQALDQWTNEWIMGKSDYRMRGLTDVQGIMGYQSRPVITLLDIKGLDEWAFNCSIRPWCLVLLFRRTWQEEDILYPAAELQFSLALSYKCMSNYFCDSSRWLDI